MWLDLVTNYINQITYGFPNLTNLNGNLGPDPEVIKICDPSTKVETIKSIKNFNLTD
jgi:hypothetical protein